MQAPRDPRGAPCNRRTPPPLRAPALGAIAVIACWSWVGRARAALPVVRPRVVNVYPHDPAAFTQGLLYHEGQLLESTGLYGRSSLRRVELESGQVLLSRELPSTEFGEGLALVGDQLIQLTWKSGRAPIYALSGLAARGEHRYQGEGWGLCFDGERLVMTDGSARLFFRDPTSFELLSSVAVTREGALLSNLNELECVGGAVLANVWQTDLIVRIDPDSGRVLADVDASELLSAGERSTADVLNGIAHSPDTGRYFLTGKLWPKLFEVEPDFGAESSGEAKPAASSGCGLGASAGPAWAALAALSGLLAALAFWRRRQRSRRRPS